MASALAAPASVSSSLGAVSSKPSPSPAAASASTSGGPRRSLHLHAATCEEPRESAVSPCGTRAAALKPAAALQPTGLPCAPLARAASAPAQPPQAHTQQQPQPQPSPPPVRRCGDATDLELMCAHLQRRMGRRLQRSSIPPSRLPVHRCTPMQRSHSQHLYAHHYVKAWLRTHSMVPQAVELTAARKEALRECFELLDSDKSGTIDQEELASALRALKISTLEMQAVIKAGDRDGERHTASQTRAPLELRVRAVRPGPPRLRAALAPSHGS
eukprot:3832356-Prymnesium_polylepis.1